MKLKQTIKLKVKGTTLTLEELNEIERLNSLQVKAVEK